MKKKLYILICLTVLWGIIAGCTITNGATASSVATKDIPESSLTTTGSAATSSSEATPSSNAEDSNAKVSPTPPEEQIFAKANPSIQPPPTGDPKGYNFPDQDLLPAIAAFAVTSVSDFATLEAAVQGATDGDIIQIDNDITFTNTITIPDGVSLSFISATGSPVRLVVDTADLRHFSTSGSSISLSFDNVILDGTQVGGGIAAYSALTLNGIRMENIYSVSGAIESRGNQLELNGAYFDTIRGSSAGGAIYCTSSSLIINNSSFTNCATINYSNDPRGGAIAFSGNSASIDNTSFKDCFTEGQGTYGYGGGAYYSSNYSASLSLNNTHFDNCYAYASAGTSSHGGAIQTGNSITMTGGGFTNCWASGYGGSIINNSMYRNNSWVFDGVTFSETHDPIRQDGTQMPAGTAWDAGAIYMDSVSNSYQLSLTITNSTFKNLNGKYNGSVLYISNIANVNFDHITVTGNGLKSPDNYGNVSINNYYEQDNSVSITDSTFNQNMGESFYFSGHGNIEIKDSTFYENEGRSTLFIYGNEAINAIPKTKATILNTTFHDNQSIYYGTLYAMGSDLDLYVGESSSFEDNQAVSGGGIYFNVQGTLTVEDTTFKGNKAGSGGAINSSVNTLIGNSQFLNNTGTTSGGAIYTYANDGATLAIQNSTFSGNQAPKGGAIYTDNLATTTVDALSIFEFNKADRGYVMTDSADIALHSTNILTNRFSAMFENGPSFQYGYNNFDINYITGEEIVLETITFDPQNGTPAFDQTVVLNQQVPVPDTPIRDGFTFEGWNTAADGTGSLWDFETDTATGPLTLFAQWTPIPTETTTSPTTTATTTGSTATATTTPPPDGSPSSTSGSSTGSQSSTTSSSSTSGSATTSSQTSGSSDTSSESGATVNTSSEPSSTAQSSGSQETTAVISPEASGTTLPSELSESGDLSNAQRRDELRNKLLLAGVLAIRIGNTDIPVFGQGEDFVWSLLSLILMLGNLAIAIIVLVIKLRKSDVTLTNRQQISMILAFSLAVVGLIAFFLLYNLSGLMVLMDSKTIIFGLLLVGGILSLIFFRRRAVDSTPLEEPKEPKE